MFFLRDVASRKGFSYTYWQAAIYSTTAKVLYSKNLIGYKLIEILHA